MNKGTCPIGLHGRELPLLGLGTFQPNAAPPEVVKQAVLDGLNAGYGHIDTAFMYGDGVVERAVGEALREWGGPREEVWVVSKLANAHHSPEDVSAAVELSLKNLGLEYLDVYLMHYPVAYFRIGSTPEEWQTARHQDRRPKINVELTLDYAATWAAMEDLVRAGKVKEIGLSNFSMLKIRKLLQTATIRPSVHQTELHPYLPQPEMIVFCESEGIHVIAHSPLGGRPVPQVALNSHVAGPMEDPTILEIARKNNCSPANVLLKWALQRGTSVAPKSYNRSHIASNISVLKQADLPSEDMQAISSLRAGDSYVRFMDPSRYWGFDIFDEKDEQPPPNFEASTWEGPGGLK